MKRTITLLVLACSTLIKAQTFTADFETFTLAPNSAYSSTNSVPFQTSNASFEYTWDTQYSIWDGGFAYTNKYDSTTAGYTNMYGVKPLKGYNSSNIYLMAQNHGVIRLKAPYNMVDGFYITNSTYAYKSMLLGDMFSKKFGGTSGNDNDWFKVTVKGYINGAMKTDSVVYYLADYRFANNANDYIVSTWQWLNTNSLGVVDSLKFFMYSSDVGQYGMNTPGFFGIDNFTTYTVVGIPENTMSNSFSVYPNPCSNVLNIQQKSEGKTNVIISDITGKAVLSKELSAENSGIDFSTLNNGVYIIELTDASNNKVHKKIIKE